MRRRRVSNEHAALQGQHRGGSSSLWPTWDPRRQQETRRKREAHHKKIKERNEDKQQQQQQQQELQENDRAVSPVGGTEVKARVLLPQADTPDTAADGDHSQSYSQLPRDSPTSMTLA